jgi:hypothetical protein
LGVSPLQNAKISAKGDLGGGAEALDSTLKALRRALTRSLPVELGLRLMLARGLQDRWHLKPLQES